MGFSLAIIRQYVPDLLAHDMQGLISGKLLYSVDDNLFKGDFLVDSLQTNWGNFGDCSVNFSVENDIFIIHSMVFQGIHSGHLSGTVHLSGDYFIYLNSGARILMDEVYLFKDYGVSGILGAQGTFQQNNGDLLIDTKLTSDQIIVQGMVVQSLLSDVQINRDGLTIQRFNGHVDDGYFALSGRVWGDDSVIWQSKMDDLLMDVFVEFDNVSLASITDAVFSYTTTLDRPVGYGALDYSSLPIYSKYGDDVLTQYFTSFFSNDLSLSIDWWHHLQGRVNGRVGYNTQTKQLDVSNVRFESVSIADLVGFDTLFIDTILLKDQIVTYRFNAKNVSAFGDRLSDFRMTMRMDYDQMVLDVLDTYVFYNNQIILNPVTGSLDFKNKDVLFPFKFNGDHLNLVSFFVPAIDLIQNEGHIQGRLEGSFDQVYIYSDQFELRRFMLTFDTDYSVFRSPFRINDYDVSISSSNIQLRKMPVIWQGEDTFRLVTRQAKKNTFVISGDIQLDPFNLNRLDRYGIGYDLSMQNTFISINFPQFFVGDLFLKSTTFSGYQEYPLSLELKNEVLHSLGTMDENGPTLSSVVEFRDGRITFPDLVAKQNKPRIGLDAMVKLGPGVFIEGGFWVRACLVWQIMFIWKWMNLKMIIHF